MYFKRLLDSCSDVIVKDQNPQEIQQLGKAYQIIHKIIKHHSSYSES